MAGSLSNSRRGARRQAEEKVYPAAGLDASAICKGRGQNRAARPKPTASYFPPTTRTRAGDPGWSSSSQRNGSLRCPRSTAKRQRVDAGRQRPAPSRPSLPPACGRATAAVPSPVFSRSNTGPGVDASTWQRTTAVASAVLAQVDARHVLQRQHAGHRAVRRLPAQGRSVARRAGAGRLQQLPRASGVASSACQRRTSRALLTEYGPTLPSSDRNRTRSTSSPRVSTSVSPSGISEPPIFRSSMSLMGMVISLSSAVRSTSLSARLRHLDAGVGKALLRRHQHGVVVLLDLLVRQRAPSRSGSRSGRWRRCCSGRGRPGRRRRRWRGISCTAGPSGGKRPRRGPDRPTCARRRPSPSSPPRSASGRRTSGRRPSSARSTSAGASRPEMRTARTPTLATSAGSFLPASAAASSFAPFLRSRKALNTSAASSAFAQRFSTPGAFFAAFSRSTPASATRAIRRPAAAASSSRDSCIEHVSALLAVQRGQAVDGRLAQGVARVRRRWHIPPSCLAASAQAPVASQRGRPRPQSASSSLWSNGRMRPQVARPA